MAGTSESGLTTYTWGDGSIIPQIDVRKDGVAYIHAAKNAPDLPALRELMESKGWATSSDVRGGEFAILRISKFDAIQDIIAVLQEAHAVSGQPKVTIQEAAIQKRDLSSLKANSLRASGLFYIIGDVLYTLKGFLGNASHKDKGIGLSMMAGDLIFLGFGKKDDEKEFASLIKKLKHFYDKNGIEIPDYSALSVETLAKPGGFLEKTYDFIHENVNIFKCLAEVIGGGFALSDGFEKDANGKRDRGMLVSGTALITGFGAAALIKEKKIDPEEYAKANMFKKLWMRIQAQPLRLAALGGLTNNVGVIISIFKLRKDEKAGASKTHWELRAAGVAAMIVANIFYSISKKTAGGNIKSDAIVDDVYGLSAQVLNHMDPQTRETAIKQTAQFLGERVEIKDNKEQIEAYLRKEIGELRQNPWFGTSDTAASTQQKSTGATKFQAADTNALAMAGNHQAMQALQAAPGMQPKPSLDAVTAANTPEQKTLTV